MGYAEAGPGSGRVVLLLHGWPYDIHTYVDVAPALAAQGYRVIVPFLRGYGTTRFLSGGTLRNGQQSALAVDGRRAPYRRRQSRACCRICSLFSSASCRSRFCSFSQAATPWRVARCAA